MSFNNMTDNWRNNQCFTNSKSVYKTRNPYRIYCHKCNEYTESIEPIILRRYQIHNFCIYAMCEKCKLLTSIALTDFYYQKFPMDYFNLPINKPYLNYIITKQGEKRNILSDLFSIINEQLV